MVNRQNIQVLFDELSLGGVDAFMQTQGWRIGEHERDDVRVFEREEEGRTIRLWIWKSPQQPKFRSRIQNLVFTMAVRTRQEPIEIANAIYDSRPVETNSPEATTVSAPPAPLSLCVRNEFPRELPITLVGRWTAPHSMPAGSAWRLVLDPTDTPPEVVLTSEGLEIRSTQPEGVRLFEEIPQRARQGNIAQFLQWALQTHSTQLDSAGGNLDAAIARAGFELDDLAADGGIPPFARKAIAALLSAVASELPADEVSPSVLWDLGRLLAGRLGGHLETYPKARQELWQIAREDEDAAPRHTLDWLLIRTWSPQG